MSTPLFKSNLFGKVKPMIVIKNVKQKNDGRFKKGMVPWMLGKKHSEETKNKIKLKRALQKNVYSIKNSQHLAVKRNIGRKNTPQQIKNISFGHLGIKPSKKAIEMARQRFLGENNPNWKGGITPINLSIRQSYEMKLWRKSVFERDNYTCIWCRQRGGKLEADHIKPFSLFPELRFAIDNGRTLCKECHKKTDTYMGRTRWKEYGKSI